MIDLIAFYSENSMAHCLSAMITAQPGPLAVPRGRLAIISLDR